MKEETALQKAAREKEEAEKCYRDHASPYLAEKAKAAKKRYDRLLLQAMQTNNRIEQEKKKQLTLL